MVSGEIIIIIIIKTPFDLVSSKLLKITYDIFTGFDDHRSTILVDLDQAAALDCVDHETLVSRLKQTLGVTASELDSISS